MPLTPQYRARGSDSYIEIQVPGSGDVTLTALEAAHRVICLQGTLTGARRVLVPLDAEDRLNWIIKNETTGVFRLDFGAVGGNWFTVPPDDAIQFYANGTELSRSVGSVLERETTLTAAQVKALHTTPITLVPAPGMGRILEYLSSVWFHEYGGSNIFTGAGSMAVAWYDGSGFVDGSETILHDNFLELSLNTISVPNRSSGDLPTLQTQLENVPLVIYSSGAVTGNAANDNVVRIRVRYAIHETGF